MKKLENELKKAVLDNQKSKTLSTNYKHLPRIGELIVKRGDTLLYTIYQLRSHINGKLKYILHTTEWVQA